MLFNSPQFLIFFPIVTALYFALPHRWRYLHLLVASCVFYMAFVPVYILILAFIIVVDYVAGLMIERSEGSHRRAYLVASLVANIGTLAVFKYYNFFVEQVQAVIPSAHLPLLSLLLPIGLSFHTFQAMSYTIEVYRGRQRAERHFGIYALYVMFYPQLVAGPIERPQNLLHQFREVHHFDLDEVVIGLRQMMWGFFKKVAVADRLAVAVDIAFGQPRARSALELVLGAILFTVQLYADFSGYSDIALGSARVMGFRLSKNFNRPYAAQNLADFWRRWHITLYSWFNDYLFTPLSLKWRDWDKPGIVLAILVTFSVSGLWHGAAWTCIVWGALHGIGVSFELLTRRWRSKRLKLSGPLGNGLAVAITFAFVCFTFIFFRARTLSDASHFVVNLPAGLGSLFASVVDPSRLIIAFDGLSMPLGDVVFALIAVILMFGIEYFHAKRLDMNVLLGRYPAPVRWVAYYALVSAIVFSSAQSSGRQFIYFQF